jgi:hypothetical protein
MTQPSQDLNKKLSLNKRDKILLLLFFASFCLSVWAIAIYNETIIDTKYLLAAAAFGTITVFVLLLFRHKSSYSIIWTFFISMAIGGGFFFFSFLYLNKLFASSQPQTEEFQIIETGHLGRVGKGNCFIPYVIIDFNGTQKQLVFSCEDKKTIKDYHKVAVTFSKGLFGFAIIKAKQLDQ